MTTTGKTNGGAALIRAAGRLRDKVLRIGAHLLEADPDDVTMEDGRIFVRGHDVTDWQPHERAKGGVARSFQDALLYPSLTVAENVVLPELRSLMRPLTTTMGMP